MRALTDGWADRRTDGCTDGRYQVHYLLALRLIIMCRTFACDYIKSGGHRPEKGP